MSSLTARPLLAVVLTMALPGCAGPQAQEVDRDIPAAPSMAPTPTDTGTPSQVDVDPNATTIGGAHVHDWWAGDAEAAILEKEIPMGPGGVCVGVLGVPCENGAYRVIFDPADAGQRPNNVWPGTGKVSLDVHIDGHVIAPFDVIVQMPKRNPLPLFTVDSTTEHFEVENVLENETDPPHFRTSGWSFRLSTHPLAGNTDGASVYEGRMHWTVKIHRGARPLPVDPPHPDYWGNETRRLLWAEEFEESGQNYPVGNKRKAQAYPLPENATVLPGTAKMRVALTWESSSPILDPELGAEYSGADQGGRAENERAFQRPRPIEDSPGKRVYEFEVRPDEWDSPYATTSEWRFRWYFDDPTTGEYGSWSGTMGWAIEIFRDA